MIAKVKSQDVNVNPFPTKQKWIHISDTLRRSPNNPYPQKFKNRFFFGNNIAIYLGGGLGDHINALAILNQFIPEKGRGLKFHIFSTNLGHAKFVFSRSKLKNICSKCLNSNRRLHKLTARANLLFMDRVLLEGKFFKNKSGQIEFENSIRAFDKLWDSIDDSHPFFGGLAADESNKLGYSRLDLLANSLGLNTYSLPALPTFEPNPNLPDEYITIHDGVDHTINWVKGISMKQFSASQWQTIIFDIKRKNPNIKVVQIGLSSSQNIVGVDFDLRGKTDFHSVIGILQNSKLHIDSDSGITRLAWWTETPRITFFLSTQPKYYATPGAIIFSPSECGGCAWWGDQYWLNRCIRNFEKPICRETFPLRELALSANNLLSSKSYQQSRGEHSKNG
jgi:hypothetical protein